MKKILFVFMCLIMSIIICSCREDKIAKIENVTWKSDIFELSFTSEQLQNQGDENDKSIYSNITVNDKKYLCRVRSCNGTLGVHLYNDDYSTFDFYNVDSETFNLFIFGYESSPKKVRNEDYQYTFEITLVKDYQYYDYCIANGIEFPETITFYGYENN